MCEGMMMLMVMYDLCFVVLIVYDVVFFVDGCIVEVGVLCDLFGWLCDLCIVKFVVMFV